MNGRSIVLLGIIVAAALSRLVDHPPNFTPILAVTLFGAACFRNRWTGLAVSLGVMLISDAALDLTTSLGLYGGWMAQGYGFHAGMVPVYLAVALTWLLGLSLRGNKSFLPVAGCTLAGSIVFFLVTNLVWWPGHLEYPQTWSGQVQSYVAAIPFFGWTLAGTAYYSAIIFGGFALAERRYPALQPALS